MNDNEKTSILTDLYLFTYQFKLPEDKLAHKNGCTFIQKNYYYY